MKITYLLALMAALMAGAEAAIVRGPRSTELEHENYVDVYYQDVSLEDQPVEDLGEFYQEILDLQTRAFSIMKDGRVDIESLIVVKELADWMSARAGKFDKEGRLVEYMRSLFGTILQIEDTARKNCEAGYQIGHECGRLLQDDSVDDHKEKYMANVFDFFYTLRSELSIAVEGDKVDLVRLARVRRAFEEISLSIQGSRATAEAEKIPEMKATLQMENFSRAFEGYLNRAIDIAWDYCNGNNIMARECGDFFNIPEN